MPLNELTSQLGIHRAAHLLRRVTFGATKQQIDAFAALTPQQAVNILFNTNLPDPELPLDLKTNAEWVISGNTDANSNDEALRDYFKAWYIGQMLSIGITDDNLKLAYAARERITFFLHTHFTTMEEKVNSSRALYFQNALFRLFALDKDDELVEIIDEETGQSQVETAPRNFKELTKKFSLDNATLRFLDGNLNVKGAPNENYAREMFELFTVGRGLEAVVNEQTSDEVGDYFTFKEQDVQAAARVLTGFKFDNEFNTIDQYTGLPQGKANPGSHSTQASEKEFSEYYNGEVIDQDAILLENGQPSQESMIDEVGRMIDMIYENEETAKHICRKIYRFFVYYDITEEINNTIIEDMAQVFVSNNYKLQPVLEALFKSEYFYEASTDITDDKFGGIIKSPLDLVLGSHLFFETSIPDYTTELEQFYEFINGQVIAKLENQGMNFYEPYEVAGYGAYHQYPVFNRNWISTNYLAYRYQFISRLFTPSSEDALPLINLLDFVKENFSSEGEDAKQLIISMAPYLLPVAQNLDFDSDLDGRGMTKERLRFFLQTFIQYNDYNTDADAQNLIWHDLYVNNNYDDAGIYLNRLFNSMLQSPEYQLF
ncbi:DUF1800 domain-containing protein [Fulvivirga maritima]|uniref:DUF1800 domain-containing protein n=1 Tax=Fulvivirga maritima TaxID=2904247 RepID=UPI001F3C472F|nr:DUF1800 family protein [Fulvivirga maritima]UII26047.1 DUF1800 domain-containing protein [Fulvivirga maritima]